MRLIFAGTPEFAKVALQALLDAGHEVVLVLTQPDRPAGRGLKLQASPVKQLAQAHGLPVCQPQGLKLDGKYADNARVAQTALQQAVALGGAQAMVVVAYGLILPPWVLASPPRGCLNIHASLLPRWRGAAPIHRAIEAGDPETGVTLMQMDAGLDTGPMLLAQALPIAPDDTTGRLHDKLALLGAKLCLDTLTLLEQGTARPVPQPEPGVSYAEKISKAESQLDWSTSAETLSRRIRALNPAPGAHTSWGDDTFKVWMAVPDPRGAFPGIHPTGTVLDANPQGIWVACGTGILQITELQKAGAKRMPLADLLRGSPLQAGDVLGLAPTAGIAPCVR